MPIRARSAATLLLTLAAGPARAGDPPPTPAAETLLVRRCTMQYEREAQVGAIYQGANATFLQECLVSPGDRVKAGQSLGRLQNQDLHAEMGLRKAEAENTLDVELSENKLAQLKTQLQQAAPLVEKNYMIRVNYTLLQLQAKATEIEVAKAKFDRSLARLHFQETEAQYRNRDFHSPIDGVVVQVYKHAGDRILLTDPSPVFLVVDDRTLLVKGEVDIGAAWRVRKGQRVRVSPVVEGADLPVEREEFLGQITFVDNRIDTTTRTCEVYARVENRDLLLRAGLEASMEITLTDDPAPPPPAPDGRASRGRDRAGQGRRGARAVPPGEGLRRVSGTEDTRPMAG